MSAGFNFNNITLQSGADITKIMENFNKIETNGITDAKATRIANSNQDGWMSSTDKVKLNGIAAGAQVNNITTVNMNGTAQPISNGTLTLTEEDPTVPAWAKQGSKPTYAWSEIQSKPTFVTQSVVGNFWKGTQAQYDAIATKNATTLYMIVEEAD